MRIITFCVTLSYFLILVHSIDEHRPKKKEKRQLDYALSQHYAGPHSYRLERRISNGSPPFYSQSQYHPGLPRSYRKGRPHSLPAPPYAVQMEPLIHYSQRDPLYDTNTLPPDIDPGQEIGNHQDPIDRGGSGDTIYIPHKPLIKYVEKPVYIKEPEPIIEIIIKESNVTLPPPPTEAPPPPQKKKKEEVQVFYVKYKKNPNGYGKDAVIYDKPIPAISPVIPEEPEPEEEWKDTPAATGYGGYGGYSNEVTEPPKPSTTLRTIIKPDSEVYHSPGNNVKVTFGKEGFDYDKRSSKPEDYPGPPVEQYPRARQLTSYSDVYFKRPTFNNNYQSSSNEYRSEVRPPQSYRPFNSYSSSSNQYNSRPPNREFNNRPPPFFPPSKYPNTYSKSSSSTSAQSPSSRPSFPNFSHSISHPPPSQYQSQKSFSNNNNNYSPLSQPSRTQPQFSDVLPPSQRKPVPYTPFEKIRPSQPTFSQPLPQQQQQSFNNQPQPTQETIHHQLPRVTQTIQFRPETHFSQQQQLPLSRAPPSFAEVNNQFKVVDQSQQQIYHQQPQQSEIYQQQQQQQQQQNFNQQQYNQQQQYQQTVQNILPPGGQLIHSLPKYEQHLVVDPATGQLSQSLPLQHQQASSSQQIQQQSQDGLSRGNKQVKQKAQNHAQTYRQQPSNNKPAYANSANHRSVEQSTARVYSTTPSTTTTTHEPEKPSTTTKDPKILEAQLPDEVPEELRKQLLSSGILNNADISILDYDKVGDIPLSALPPDQLANFYSAGGAQQLAAAGSEAAPQYAHLTSRRDEESLSKEQDAEESQVQEVVVKPSEAEMKVVKYNPETEKGQKVQDAYISENAKQVDPVVLNDNTYNRYLPLKLNGTQFPIPDVPELKGKFISSVVVLAPISYDFSSNRQTREASPGNDIEFLQNKPLKELLENPTQENYRKFLENEKKTSIAQQAVILLVAGQNNATVSEKEIFMYDLATKTVSKLNGELSAAFVEAAEANSSDEVNPDEPVANSRIDNQNDENKTSQKHH